MTKRDIHHLSDLIRRRRIAINLSAAELARRADVTTATITRLELQQIPEPRAGTLRRIADALQLPTSDLLASADYLDAGELPTFTPYLRSKYGYLSDRTQDELAAAFRDITARHGYTEGSSTGPAHHEDEA